jgi:hypothetical protein
LPHPYELGSALPKPTRGAIAFHRDNIRDRTLS